jgi:hypothetical protein
MVLFEKGILKKQAIRDAAIFMARFIMKRNNKSNITIIHFPPALFATIMTDILQLYSR